MKRSQALEIIWEAINELEDADHILSKLERAGMLPPLINRPSIVTDSYCTADVNMVNEWEPEENE
jgi:hypothetical protein